MQPACLIVLGMVFGTGRTADYLASGSIRPSAAATSGRWPTRCARYDRSSPRRARRRRTTSCATMTSASGLLRLSGLTTRKSGGTPDLMVCGLRIRGQARITTVLRTSSFWNVGCATRRNISAMVENPGDLVQPAGEPRAYPSSVRPLQKSIGRIRARRRHIKMLRSARLPILASNPAHDETS